MSAAVTGGQGKPKRKRRAKAIVEVTNPDDWTTGLRFGLKGLNTKSVSRAKKPSEVVYVAMCHNTRIGTEGHRQRSPIDKERTPLNEVLRGSGDPHIAAECAANMLPELGIEVRRYDTIMAIELVCQPPDGWDTPAFYAASLKWVDTRYQARFVLSAIVHRDQKRPHMHVVVLPIIESDGEYRLCGSELSSEANRLQAQRSSYMASIRQELGIRPDRKPKPMTATFISSGKGPKTHAAAAKADAALVRRSAAAAGNSNLIAHQPHSPSDRPTDLIAPTSYCASLERVNRLFSAGVSAGLFCATPTAILTPAPRPPEPPPPSPKAINCRPFIIPASVRAHLAAQAQVAAQDTNSSVIANHWQQTPGLKADRGPTRVREFILPASLSGNIASAAQRTDGESGGNIATATAPEQDANRAATGNSSTPTRQEQGKPEAQSGNSSTAAAASEPPSGNSPTRADASKGEPAASTLRISTPDFQYADMALMPHGTLAKQRGGGHRTAKRNSGHASPHT